MFGWLLFFLISIGLAFINPFIGAFAAIGALQLIVNLCFNISSRSKFNRAYRSHGENEEVVRAFDKSGRNISAVWCVLSVLMFLITSAGCAAVFGLLSGKLNFMNLEPMNYVDVIPDEWQGISKLNISGLMLCGTVLFNLISTILVFVCRSRMVNGSRTKTEEVKEASENIKFRLGWLGAVTLVLAAVAGLLDKKVGWITLVFHGAFLLLILVLYILIAFNRKTQTLSNKLGHAGKVFMNRITTDGRYNNVSIAVLWFITIITLGVEALMHFVLIGTNFSVVAAKFGDIFLYVSWALDLIFSIALTRSIKKIGKTV